MTRLRQHLSIVVIALVAGMVGANVPAIAHGVQHALFAHDSRKLGGVAASGYLQPNSTLRSGKVLTGVYAAWGAGGYLGDTVNFRIRLPANIPSSNVHFISAAVGSSPDCPAPGRARRGHFCAYETGNLSATFGQIQQAAGTPGVARAGFMIYYTSAASSSLAYGVWAVRAP